MAHKVVALEAILLLATTRIKISFHLSSRLFSNLTALKLIEVPVLAKLLQMLQIGFMAGDTMIENFNAFSSFDDIEMMHMQ